MTFSTIKSSSWTTEWYAEAGFKTEDEIISSSYTYVPIIITPRLALRKV